jgi:glucan phosphoethanolaminetransferase (alkaline phosphatase superfamily)
MNFPVFFITTMLAIICIAGKLALAWPRIHRAPDLWQFFAISGEDVLVVLIVGALMSLALRLSKRKPVAQRILWRSFLVFTALAAVYAVVNVGIYRAVAYPLNASMFGLVGRFTDLRSSITSRCTPGLMTALALVMIGFPLLALRPLSNSVSRKVRLGIICLAGIWSIYGIVMHSQAEPDTFVDRAGRNPHRELIESLAQRLILNRRASFTDDFPQSNLDDFRPAAAFVHPPLPWAKNPPRNVLLIVMESTGAQYLSLYGAPYDTTPNLVAESKQAVVFDHFYSNATYTFRSFIPLVAAVYPGMPWRYRADMKQPMHEGLAGVLAERGYRTAFLAAANPAWGGMDWDARCVGIQQVIGPLQLGGPAASSWGTEDGVLVDGIIKWIDQDRSRPFFAIAWTDQTHDPYTLSKDTQPISFIDPSQHPHGESLNRYLNALHQADRHIERLLQALRDRGLADDTLVVITSDHGEAFGEHEVMGHATGIYNQVLHVPMMIWNPRMFSECQRVEKVGAHVDINPTIAHILGIEPPAQWQGASLFSPDHPGRAYTFLEFLGYKFAVIDGNDKYILHYGDGVECLYDVQDDPEELFNRASRVPELTDKLRGRMSAFVHAEEAYLNAAR